MTSDEYFDSVALLCDLVTENTTESVPNMLIAASMSLHLRDHIRWVYSHHLQNNASMLPSGSLHSSSKPQTIETMASATMPKRLRVPDALLPVTASLDQQPNLMALNHDPELDTTNEDSSNWRGGTSHHAQEERTAGRMAKLMRKYYCFIPI